MNIVAKSYEQSIRSIYYNDDSFEKTLNIIYNKCTNLIIIE
jgi:hypothetical protein